MPKCDHQAVEQVRKDMKVGDYFDAITNSLDEPKYARLGENYHEMVELTDENATDMRIVCRNCFLSTGWMKVDVKGMPPGIGIPVVHAKWDEVRQHDVEEWSAVQRSRAVRPKMILIGSGT